MNLIRNKIVIHLRYQKYHKSFLKTIKEIKTISMNIINSGRKTLKSKTN